MHCIYIIYSGFKLIITIYILMTLTEKHELFTRIISIDIWSSTLFIYNTKLSDIALIDRFRCCE